jgi:hypothetical protein
VVTDLNPSREEGEKERETPCDGEHGGSIVAGDTRADCARRGRRKTGSTRAGEGLSVCSARPICNDLPTGTKAFKNLSCRGVALRQLAVVILPCLPLAMLAIVILASVLDTSTVRAVVILPGSSVSPSTLHVAILLLNVV